ncbi:hypothetical protein ZYGR_0AD03630 [Zygosaccharomyces rouxii]|uniref:ZYRO0G14542p n=2 Tax=Zygosaccharomyces rouxii TaxID=4956 RepID=C5E0P5_ZYGRC|nr:uncharacterized protein ZYRO0G14542g [Zygosaccharomyces rouxii]KAH9202673.1 hypothetical protein LQ764DRAFT_36316 [Zygosaccharomyces rouxii]GAV51180.1 hypothetical protein ZYGR_0AD03630 [Zygosaccharomyces rouxii]CAR29679.1 ZYRO0G14542p [Zygosaccharomyces rouxii]
MFNHIYGSPFPTINPRVRYKTALERAGFDVNYDGNKFDKPPSIRGLGRRNVSTGNLNEPLEPPKRSPSRVNSLPENRAEQSQPQPQPPPQLIVPPSPAKTTNDVPGSPTQQQRPRPPPPTQPQQAPASSPAPNPVELPLSASAKSQVPASQADSQADTQAAPGNPSQGDPIEKSFMLLTRSDTASTIDQSANTSRFSSQEFPRDTDSSRVSERSSKPSSKEFAPFVDAPSNVPDPDPVPSDTDDRDDDSVNIEPEPELQVSLESGNKRATATTGEIDEEEEISPLNVTSPPRHINKPSHYSHHLSQNPELNAANAQVEKLIAQLDDVSLSKTAQLTNMSKEPSLPRLQTDVGNSKFKNSSAYLSGFQPPYISPPIEQSIMQDDVPSEIGSPMTADTPMFYNFQKTVQHEFTPQVEDSPQIEPSKLMQVPPSKSQERVVDPTPNLEFKYPPGTGPCRKCGIEPTGKRMYSKKDDELSGQWHRDCFRCLTCNIRFNKSIPCYILDDKPYCRRHYHEENSSICQTCREFIEGECVENDRMERFHIDCLVCFLCREPITNDYLIFNEELPLCSNHDMESLPTELLETDPSAISKRRTMLVNFSKE